MQITGTREIEYAHHAAGYNTGIVPDHLPLVQPLDLVVGGTPRRKWRHDTWEGSAYEGTAHPQHNAKKFDYPIFQFDGFERKAHRNATTFKLIG
eukprot:1185497-Prorocentrum_minimum.AAC.7